MNGICVAIVASADATANADLLVYEGFAGCWWVDDSPSPSQVNQAAALAERRPEIVPSRLCNPNWVAQPFFCY